jgi:hypothetical protein
MTALLMIIGIVAAINAAVVGIGVARWKGRDWHVPTDADVTASATRECRAG